MVKKDNIRFQLKMFSKIGDVLALTYTISLPRKRVTKGREGSMLFRDVILGHVVVFTPNTQRRSHRGECAKRCQYDGGRIEVESGMIYIHTYYLFAAYNTLVCTTMSHICSLVFLVDE